MNNYLVTIHVRNVGDYEIELIGRTPESAGKRAIVSLWSGYHRDLTLDDFTHTHTEDLGKVIA